MKSKTIRLREEQVRALYLSENNPIQIKGVAGSGKTTIALCRAKYLMETQLNLFNYAKVAIFTYNKTLVKYINLIKSCVGITNQKANNEIQFQNQNAGNINVTNFHKWAYDFIWRRGRDSNLNLY